MTALLVNQFRTVNEAINPILIVSKLAAVCTSTKNANQKEFGVSYFMVVFQVVVSIISVLHLMFIPYGVIYIEKMDQEKNDDNSGLGSQAFITKMTNIVLISVAAITVRVTGLFRMHKILPSLLKTINNIDRAIIIRKNHDYIWILIFSAILILVSWPYQLYSILMVTTNNWIAFLMFSLNLYNNFSIISCEFQFVSLCWIIKTRFTNLNEELKDLGLKIIVDTDDSVLNKLSGMRKCYKILNESCTQLNSLYKIQLLVTLGSLTLNVLFNLYFAIFGGYTRGSSESGLKDQQVASSMNDVIWSFYYFGRFLLVCVTAGHLTDKANSTKRLICNIIHRNLDRELKQELWTFLAYTMANKIHFTACGFFKIDFALITSAVSTGATYLVILAQFQTRQ